MNGGRLLNADIFSPSVLKAQREFILEEASAAYHRNKRANARCSSWTRILGCSFSLAGKTFALLLLVAIWSRWEASEIVQNRGRGAAEGSWKWIASRLTFLKMRAWRSLRDLISEIARLNRDDEISFRRMDVGGSEVWTISRRWNNTPPLSSFLLLQNLIALEF
jgi:hypothetical protein